MGPPATAARTPAAPQGRAPARSGSPASRFKLRLLLAHPQALLAEALATLLAADPRLQVVLAPAGAAETLALIARLRPHIALIDVAHSEAGGLELARQVGARAPGTRPVVLSSCGEILTLRERTGAGVWAARDCKSGRDLSAALRALARAGQQRSLKGAPAGAPLLSPREQETLRQLASGLSNKQVGARLGVGKRTVDTYRASLMRKLRIRHLAGLVKYALRNHLTSLEE
jgi:DNA-binding NarL/FixJ family response regulator